MTTFTFGAGTHTGHVRQHNEDSYCADVDLGLWVVADGMGGHAGGEIASGIAKDIIETSVGKGEDIEDAVQQSHLAILQSVEKGIGKQEMGTTVVAAKFNESDYKLAWVGDSRGYLWNGELRQISKDQSLVQIMVDMKTITREEARFHPKKNIITQYVGQPERGRLKVDCVEGKLEPEQKMILCSDGLSDEVGDDEMKDILRHGCDNQSSDQEITDTLIEAALRNGGRDNVTVIVVSL